jgi:hypothetical protein
MSGEGELRDWTVTSGSHQTRLRLASHVHRVRPGTPLRPSGHDSWEISPDGADAKWLAAHNETGGNDVDVWKACTFITYTPNLYKAGDTLAIDYIDDEGRIHLRVDAAGKIDAVDSEHIFVAVPLK